MNDLKVHSPLKHRLVKIKESIAILFYISKVDTDAILNDVLPHRKEYGGNVMEHVTAEANGVRVLAVWLKLI